jgi:condensin complex subunit 1
MDERIDFDINDALKLYLSDPLTIPTVEAPSDLVDCENDPDGFTPALINSALNPVVESVAENPEAITRKVNFDTIQFLLKCAPTVIQLNDEDATALSHQTLDKSDTQDKSKQRRQRRSSIAFSIVNSSRNRPNCALFEKSRCASIIPGSTLSKILDLLVSSLSNAADIASADIESDDQDGIKHNKQLLEVYGFLLQWTIAAIETKATEKQASAPARGRKGAGKAKGGKDAAWDATSQLTTAMDVMSRVMKLKLSRIFVTTSERDTFISLFTRPTYLIFENEQRIKNTTIKMHAFKVLCIAVKHHGHAIGKHWNINRSREKG